MSLITTRKCEIKIYDLREPATLEENNLRIVSQEELDERTVQLSNLSEVSPNTAKIQEGLIKNYPLPFLPVDHRTRVCLDCLLHVNIDNFEIGDIPVTIMNLLHMTYEELIAANIIDDILPKFQIHYDTAENTLDRRLYFLTVTLPTENEDMFLMATFGDYIIKGEVTHFILSYAMRTWQRLERKTLEKEKARLSERERTLNALTFEKFIQLRYVPGTDDF